MDQPRMLTGKQAKKMPGRPELIHLFAWHLAELVNETDGVWPSVSVSYFLRT